MRNIYIAILILTTSPLIAQYAIGHLATDFIDVSRQNRVVGCEIYYPADAAGEEVATASGQFPLIIFGHGFVMAPGDYMSLVEHIVPQGYVMALLSTETSFSPSHSEYGLDFSFILQQFILENNNDASLFYNRITDKQAFMGHSMGGGASWLAAAADVEVDCVIGMAPAETSPSAISAALSVEVPVMVLSGTSDNVTPPADHHIPVYVNSQSECKLRVDIQEGSHCGFADSGSLCDFGELGFSGMSRTDQQNIAYPLIAQWLDWALRGNAASLQNVLNYTETSAEIISDCVVSVYETEDLTTNVFPNPVQEKFSIILPAFFEHSLCTVTCTDALGQVVSDTQNFQFYNGTLEIVTANWPNGMYHVSIQNASARVQKRVVVQKK
jgi:predicted dienelactone hydrolase